MGLPLVTHPRLTAPGYTLKPASIEQPWEEQYTPPVRGQRLLRQHSVLSSDRWETSSLKKEVPVFMGSLPTNGTLSVVQAGGAPGNSEKGSTPSPLINGPPTTKEPGLLPLREQRESIRKPRNNGRPMQRSATLFGQPGCKRNGRKVLLKLGSLSSTSPVSKRLRNTDLNITGYPARCVGKTLVMLVSVAPVTQSVPSVASNSEALTPESKFRMASKSKSSSVNLR